MTDTTEQEALALVNEVRAERGQDVWKDVGDRKGYGMVFETLCRAIERHKTDIADLQAEYEEVCKLHEAFRREVSFALETFKHGNTRILLSYLLDPYIIAKPLDPLAQAWREAWPGTPGENAIEEAGILLAAIEKRGGKIVWGEG